MVRPVIFLLGVSALPLAQKFKVELDAEIHGPESVARCDVTYSKATTHLAQLFIKGRCIIGLCSSGILIRAIAPHLRDKHNEPAVVAVAEDGSSIVPLLGGHHGANLLARRIAALCSGHAAITTASDVRLGIAFDEPAHGYSLANLEDAKAATAAALAGAPVTLYRHPGESRDPLNPFPRMPMAEWAPAFAGVTVKVTEMAESGSVRELVYHPQTLAVGVGCERGTSPTEVEELIANTLAQHGLAEASVACHASIELKADEPAISNLKEVRFFTIDELNAQEARLLTPSEAVRAEVGVAGVSEAAALAAAGPGSGLIVAKTKSQRATCAVARATSPIIEMRGHERGTLCVVGIGPGGRDCRSPEATLALWQCSEWVGYGLYLDLVSDLKQTDQTEHRFPLGAEEERVRHAIALAKQGKRVALVCSGDAGIYAMAALVYEVIDLEPCRIEVNVIPGISAFQAAAAKAGAMIGHDFCCISLSDLLTSWEVIEKRVKAAAEGDFVVSFYNPRSMKRRDQLERAFAILSQYRQPDTPVVIASNLGRLEEKVRIVRFADFNPDDVDMLTLVMVGSSQSKSFVRGDGRTYAYTPRGYARKRDHAE